MPTSVSFGLVCAAATCTAQRIVKAIKDSGRAIIKASPGIALCWIFSGGGERLKGRSAPVSLQSVIAIAAALNLAKRAAGRELS
jgi:cysteine sulfinate desulfinase/cysteine desulfurase-like protein